MHKATAYIDAGLSGLVVYASIKVFRNVYFLANGMPWYPMATLGWACLGLL